MPAKLPPFALKDFSSGMATNLNSNLAPLSSVELLMNMDGDEEIGSAVSRLGTAQIGAQLVDNKPVLGLNQFIDAVTPANNKLFATINASNGLTSVIYDVLAGSTSLTGLTASKKMRFLSFLGEMLAINGADTEHAYTGSGWITTGGAFDLGDFPGSNTCDLAIEFLDRVYAAGDDSNPDRLHFSTLSNGTTISWAGDYVDIEPEDGGGRITALAKVPSYILIFKERSLKRFNGSSAFPESLVDIGTPSQESVVMGGGLCAFYSNSSEDARGFYVTNGGRPVPISHDTTRPLKKWIDAIPAANEVDINGWATERTFAWSVGDLTVDGVVYPNVVFRYNRLLNQWSVRSYPTEFKVFARYLVSGVNTIVGGDDDGNVIRVDKTGTYTDAPSATPIAWSVKSHALTFGVNQRKRVSDRIVVRTKGAEGGTATLIADGKNQNYAKIKGNTSEIPVTKPVEGSEISFQVQGSTTAARAYVREIEPVNIEVLDNYV